MSGSVTASCGSRGARAGSPAEFEIQTRLSPRRVTEFVQLLEAEVEPRLEHQERGYAGGRLFAWLAWRPDLQGSPRARPMPTGRLWEALRDLVPAAETAECWRNGDGSSPGIRPHRDSPYASRMAWVLNLGSTRFRIWLPNTREDRVARSVHPELERVKVHPTNTEYAIDLSGGELLCFDCKRMHGSASAASRRWGIGLWTFKPEWKVAAGMASR